MIRDFICRWFGHRRATRDQQYDHRLSPTTLYVYRSMNCKRCGGSIIHHDSTYPRSKS